MKRLIVSLDEDRYEDLRRFSFEKKVPMAELVRHAIEATFEDELDAMAGQRGLEDYLRDPSQAVGIEELMKEFGIEPPRRRASKGRERTEKAAG